MELLHQFTVDRPIDDVWPVLVDLTAVAEALPGASIVDVESDGNHKGRLRVKLGPISATFSGDARYVVADEQSHRFVLEGAGGSAQGSASLRVSGSAVSDGASTRVELKSVVDLTGRIAQFGASMADDVADQLLDAFVVNLRQGFENTQPQTSATREAPGPNPVEGAADSPPPSAGWSTTSQDALHLGPKLPVGDNVTLGLVGLIGFVVGVVIGRRARRSPTFLVAIVPSPRPLDQ